jgi:putative Ca2+/H+ antiporter (TMEM165/GDT1 family)
VDWTTLLSTFGLLFVAELGDKTQLAVITQTCKYRRPWPVFLGAGLALSLVTGLGVAFGRALNALVPAEWTYRIAAIAFIALGLYVGVDLWRHWRELAACAVTTCDAAEARRLDWVAFSSTFALLFVAEMGDKTQLAALSMAARAGSPWPVFFGAALALVVVSGLGVAFGQGLCRLIPERALKLISALGFVAVGALMLAGVF